MFIVERLYNLIIVIVTIDFELLIEDINILRDLFDAAFETYFRKAL